MKSCSSFSLEQVVTFGENKLCAFVITGALPSDVLLGSVMPFVTGSLCFTVPSSCALLSQLDLLPFERIPASSSVSSLIQK